MFGSDSRLSLAASAISRQRAWQFCDYQMDASGDCGEMISKHHHANEIRALEEHGFTVQSYNEALRARLAPDYPQMSYRIYDLLRNLEVETREEFEGNRTVHDGIEMSSLAYLYGDSFPCGKCGQPINSSKRTICLDCESVLAPA